MDTRSLLNSTVVRQSDNHPNKTQKLNQTYQPHKPLPIVTRFAIRFDMWYEFEYAFRNSQRIRYASGIHSRYC
jgi:hypothetical protein